jgi:ribosomal protein S12 methylthiotransferase
MNGQLPAAVKRQRYHRLMSAQAGVAAGLSRDRVGTVQAVLVCGQGAGGRWYGRTAGQAPDIDGVVYLNGPEQPGTIVPVRITDATIYDLEGQLEPPVDSGVDSL